MICRYNSEQVSNPKDMTFGRTSSNYGQQSISEPWYQADLENCYYEYFSPHPVHTSYPFLPNVAIYAHALTDGHTKLTRAIRPTIGVQFLYKERMHGFESSYKYTCQLCGETRLKKKAMFSHLTEDTLHNRKYLVSLVTT